MASVSVSPSEAMIDVGQSVQLDASLADANGHPIANRTVTWTSSDPAIATVDQNGLVLGVSAGLVDITATSEGIAGHASVTVIQPLFAYVTNQGSNSVSIVDVNTSTLVATVPVGSNPFGLGMTPDGALAYVANLNFGNLSNVSVIETATASVVATVPVGRGPTGVATTPDGQFAYVTNAFESNVSVIDVATNTVVGTVGVGFAPRNIATTSDGLLAYTANINVNNVSAIDIATNTEIARIPVGSEPRDVATSQDGAFAYIVNFRSNSLSVIDVASNTVASTVPVGGMPFGVAITPDGGFAYVSLANLDVVEVVDLATNSVVTSIPVGDQPLRLAVSPSGRFVGVANEVSGDLSLIDVATNTVTANIPVGVHPSAVAFTNVRPVPPPPPIVLFSEDFSDDLGQWIPRGSPASFITGAEGNPAPAVSMNGDGSFDSGLESLRKFDTGEIMARGGITLTFELLRPDTPLGIHFIDGGVYLGTVNVDGFAFWPVGVRYQPNSFLMGKFGFFVNSVSHLSTVAVTERRWIPIRIVLRQDMFAEYYVDGQQLFVSPEAIDLDATAVSVAVTGRQHFADNIEVLAGVHRPN